MSDVAGTQLVPVEQVEKLIHLARGEKVLLDSDLAALYDVSTGALNRAVPRNANRFPPDFMFQLTAEEAQNLKCQSGTSSSAHGGCRRSSPYAFTEQGVAMLSSVLRSERAVQVEDAALSPESGRDCRLEKRWRLGVPCGFVKQGANRL